MKYILLALLLPASAFGSEISRGPLGIDAIGLRGPGNEILNGAGVKIGQTEFLRPADPDVDGAFNLPNSTVNPTQVTLARATATPGDIGPVPDPFDFDLYSHSTYVASVMIGTNGGVSQGAELYADGFIHQNHVQQLLSQQFISRVGIGTEHPMRAINASWGHPNGVTGNELSRGFDWMASRYDVLNVMAINDDVFPAHDSPGDSYNGITVAASERVDGAGQFRQLATFNDIDGTFDVNEVELLAPGVGIELYGLTNTTSPHNGSSFAAPHVVSTAALLHQYANLELARPETTWDSGTAHRHEVMKAVLLNSADKLAGVHGSTRTVVDYGGFSWEDSPAKFDPERPLDPYIGAGHLNARKALHQFSAGPQNGSTVDPLGWYYGETAGLATIHSFPFNQTLSGDVSITLAWDRVVEKFGGSDLIYGSTDFFQSSGPYNLDLYLLPVGWTLFGQAVAASYSSFENVEHIFAQDIPSGDYEIVVHQVGGLDQKYALAWWFGDGPTGPIPGDFNGDGGVDGADLQEWKDGFGEEYDGNDFLAWQRNYGTGVPVTAVPEPSAWLIMAGLPFLLRRRAA